MRDHQALADDAAAVADLLHLRIKPQVRIAPLERPVAERLHLLVEPGADARDLRARDAQTERLHQLVDLARRNAANVRLLHDRDQRLLRTFARLEEARKVGAASDLRDRQLDLAGARRPRTGAVAIAV